MSAPKKKDVDPDQEPTTETTITEDEIQLNDQCVLLEMAQKIYKMTLGTGKCGDQFGIPGYCPDTSAGAPIISLSTLPAYKINYDYIKKITLASRGVSFLEIAPNEVTQLSPHILISVAYYNSKGTLVSSDPIDFPNETNLKNSAFARTGQRFGAGIKEITINHEGIDTATDKIVLIDSTFVFQDFRTITTGIYSELLKLGIKGKDSNNKRYIQFEFGWNAGPALTKKFNLPSMRSTVRGELIKYTFDFAEDGSIILKTQHRGHIHSLFGNTPSANILAINKEEQESLKAASVTTIAAARKEIKANNTSRKAENTVRRLALMVMKKKLRWMGQVMGEGSTTKMKMSAKGWNSDIQTIKLALQQSGVNAADIGDMNDDALAEIGRVAARELGQIALANRVSVGTEGGVTGVGKKRRAFSKEHGRMTTIQADEITLKELIQFNNDLKTIAKGADQTQALVDDNLKQRKILQTARQEFARQVGLLRFLGLFNLMLELGEKQKVYYGGLTAEQHFDILAGVTHQPTLLKVFNGITAQSFFTTPSPMAVASMAARKAAANTTPTAWIDKANNILGDDVAKNALASGDTTIVPFVFLGEFLDTILKIPASLESSNAVPLHQLMKDTTGIDLKIVLGFIDYEAPFSNTQIKRLPLYYFPLSLKKLNNFIAREIVAKDKIFYSFGQLIKDLLQKLIEGAFFVCKRDADTGYSPTTPKMDFAFGKVGETDIFFIYDSKTFVNDLKGKHFGKYKLNLAAKIPHFYLGGPNKGIAKKVKLRDIADPTLKTAVFYKPSPSDSGIPPGGGSANDTGGNEDPSRGRWAPVVFEAEVDTLGYPNFQLGQLMFIDVRQFISAEVASDFLATGYYGIKKITHKLTKDSFTTTASAIIQVSNKDKEKLSKISDGAESVPGNAAIDQEAILLAEAAGLDPSDPDILRGAIEAVVYGTDRGMVSPGTEHGVADQEGSLWSYAGMDAATISQLHHLANTAGTTVSDAQDNATFALADGIVLAEQGVSDMHILQERLSPLNYFSATEGDDPVGTNAAMSRALNYWSDEFEHTEEQLNKMAESPLKTGGEVLDEFERRTKRMEKRAIKKIRAAKSTSEGVATGMAAANPINWLF